MLILTRKSNESIIIGNNIEVRILDLRGDQVSLGFTAPRTISIHRKEIFEAIQQENKQAAGGREQVLDSIRRSFPREFNELAFNPTTK